MNFLLLSLLAIQTGGVPAGLNLWPQVAAGPPGSTSTTAVEIIATPPTTAPVRTPGGQPNGLFAPVAIDGPQTSATQDPRADQSTSSAAPPPSGFTSSQGTAAPVSSAGSSAAAADARQASAGASIGTEASLGIAAAPSRIVIGIRGKQRTRAKTLALWTLSPGESMTVTPEQPWIKLATRQEKKGTRTYDITVDLNALPPGGVHTGIIRVTSGQGALRIPVVVELESTR